MIRIAFRLLVNEILYSMKLKKRYVSYSPNTTWTEGKILCKVMSTGEYFWGNPSE